MILCILIFVTSTYSNLSFLIEGRYLRTGNNTGIVFRNIRRKLENTFNIFKSYGHAKVQPQRYAKKSRYHGIEEYLSPQQKQMKAKRDGKDTTDVMYKDTWSGYDKNIRRNLVSTSKVSDDETDPSSTDDNTNENPGIPPGDTTDDKSVTLHDDMNGDDDDKSAYLKTDDCVVVSVSALPRKLFEIMTVKTRSNITMIDINFLFRWSNIIFVVLIFIFACIIHRYRYKYL